MDYEKAYKAVLKTATQWIKDGCTDKEKICLECVIPELRESEDERVRKWLVDYFSSIKETVWIHRDITCGQILSWLEKQKEQRPALSEVELLFRGEKVTVKRPFYRDDKGRGYSTAELDEGFAWDALRAWCEKKGISLYDLYPKAEWSEENEKIMDTIVSVLGQYIDYKAVSGTGSGYATPRYSKEIDWLKSLRPSWKPSEEQMNSVDMYKND